MGKGNKTTTISTVHIQGTYCATVNDGKDAPPPMRYAILMGGRGYEVSQEDYTNVLRALEDEATIVVLTSIDLGITWGPRKDF